MFHAAAPSVLIVLFFFSDADPEREKEKEEKEEWRGGEVRLLINLKAALKRAWGS